MFRVTALARSAVGTAHVAAASIGMLVPMAAIVCYTRVNAFTD